jgi:hypothetical protein
MDGPNDLLNKLRWEYQNVARMLSIHSRDESIGSAYFALNAATTCWHLCDWVIADLDVKSSWPIKVAGAVITNGASFIDTVKTDPAMRAIYQINNAWKHRSLRKGTYVSGYRADNWLALPPDGMDAPAMRFLGINVPDIENFEEFSPNDMSSCQYIGPIDIRPLLLRAIEWWETTLADLGYL